MSDPTGSSTRRQVERLRRQFAQHDGLPFADVLPAARIDRAIREEGAAWQEKVFTPVLTTWAFLTQVLDPAACCRAAVARVMAWLDAQGLPRCGTGTGGYCKARGRLPEGLLARLAWETGRVLHDAAPDRWRWRGRRDMLVRFVLGYRCGTGRVGSSRGCGSAGPSRTHPSPYPAQKPERGSWAHVKPSGSAIRATCFDAGPKPPGEPPCFLPWGSLCRRCGSASRPGGVPRSKRSGLTTRSNSSKLQTWQKVEGRRKSSSKSTGTAWPPKQGRTRKPSHRAC